MNATPNRVIEGHEHEQDLKESCDVCIVGSGAGGSVLAALLAQRGLDVVVLEAGGAFTSADFDLDESKAYPRLYQERGTQATDDLSITLLQGRSIGGSTTINWTTCYRTPDRILHHWAEHHGTEEISPEVLRPHFESVEQRLNIGVWPEERANPNNQVVLRGARALGWEAHPLKRNVRGCANSGYCGVGCPVNGKQAMHLTYIPDALGHGARFYSDVQVDEISHTGRRATGVTGRVLVRDTGRASAHRVTVTARCVVSAGGALHSPALLLRSGLDRGGLVGQRTMIHPVTGLSGEYAEAIRPWMGAPQSAACHEFVDRGPEQIGFFIETPPMQPMLAATGPRSFGADMRLFMQQLEHASTLIALCIDGVHRNDPGGTVTLKPDGRPSLSYPTRPVLTEAFAAAHRAMADIHFAAGATRVSTLHTTPVVLEPGQQERLAALSYGSMKHSIFSAHLMGGCGFGTVVDPKHRFMDLENLFVVDGSVFPTSLGVNPSQTIYALASRASDYVADSAG